MILTDRLKDYSTDHDEEEVMKHSIFRFVMVVAVILGLFGTPSYASASFLAEYGFIDKADKQGEIPDAVFTVEEFGTLLAKINRLAPAEGEDELSFFSDVSEISKWARPYLNACVLNGFFLSYDPGTISPKSGVSGALLVTEMFLSLGYDNLSREEAERMLEDFDLSIGNDVLTRKEAFHYIWKFLTKPICRDGGYLIEKSGMVDMKKLIEEGGVIDDIIPYEVAASYVDSEHQSLKPELTIMHGGGRIHGFMYPNTAEAVLSHYERGKRVFEVDFLKTRDGSYIGLHHWSLLNSPLFEEKEGRLNYNGVPLTKKAFTQLGLSRNMTYIDFDVLSDLIGRHKDIVIITDTKDDNSRLLRYIAQFYPSLMENIIPQVYNRDEYREAQTYGFQKIIYTLYRSQDTPRDVLDFIDESHPYAITIPYERLNERRWRRLLKKDTNIFVHTLNSLRQSELLFRMGVDGIYTDDL